MSETLVSTLKKLEVIIRPGKLEAVKRALAQAGYSGVTISQAEGHGTQRGLTQDRPTGSFRMELVPKLRMEIVIAEADLEPLIEAIMKASQTGQVGDGKIFVSDIRDAVRIRTGERGTKAI